MTEMTNMSAMSDMSGMSDMSAMSAMSAMTDLQDVPAGALVAARAAHWQRARWITLLLLLLWIGTTIFTAVFARQLANFTLFGWPLSFYLAAQGACLIYLGIIGVYALWLRRLDRSYARRIAAARGGHA
ncbi:MAG: DUF4212 domain-containing protein [Gammaproteobacteria bacterium]